MSSPFEKVPAQVDFSKEELRILKLWDELDAFAESNRRREGHLEPYVFYDGPPFATGTPHYGHLLAGTIKDIVPRYWNMRGHPVERRFGWDCHGLPIEALAQEALGLAGTAQILEAGVDVFNEQCRSMVQTYVAEWRRTVTRMGRWVDFDRDYKTMDPNFMETVWWVFKKLWDQGRIYKSYRIMPYSWRLTTPLSNFEANSNYKEVQDPAITVRFRVESLPDGVEHPLLSQKAEQGKLYVLAWTTTPWTLPSNLALCAGPEIPYVAVSLPDDDAVYLLAEARAETVFKKQKPEVLGRLIGRDLAGLRYAPLFPYFAGRENCFVVLTADFVTVSDGTGIVHLAPAYGEDDFAVCRAAKIDLVDPLDAEARFTSLAPDYEGQFCKDADKQIIADLKADGRLLKQETIVHSYPYDDRTDSPLIYRAIEAWYVRVADMRDELVAQNDTVGWVPEAVGKNRFGNWLKDANDWNISRNRFWGSCIPIWINEEDPEDMLCIGSLAELAELSGQHITDLHKHVVDEVLIVKDGKTYRRTPEVLDCWFESGAMPYAQQHYPFEPGDAPSGDGSDERFQKFFPARFIAEGLDQTRGWFYTLLILGTALFGKSPYENVIVNGLILAEDGQKMSKRKKNYPDPNETLETYGADALRAYMIDSPVVRGEPLKFSERGLKEIVRTVVLPYWNALSFFSTYATLDGFDPRQTGELMPLRVDDRSLSDRWILSVLQSLVRDVNHEMENYRLYNVVPRLVSFIDDLTNWYIRISRPRFWKSEDSADKAAAYHTLYEVLITFARVLAPFMPFVTEMVYQKLVVPVDPDAPASVHFCDFPKEDPTLIDVELEARGTVARSVVSLARKLRDDHKLKVRQPLASLTVVHRDKCVRDRVLTMKDVIENELNVKRVAVEADESRFIELSIKPNFKTLGKRCGKKLGVIKQALDTWGQDEVDRLEQGETVSVADEEIFLEDVLLVRKATGEGAVATDGHLTVVLDTNLTAELVAEGHAREFISLLQNERKGAGLDVSDRIEVVFSSLVPELVSALEAHLETIRREVLATSLGAGICDESASALTVNGHPVSVNLKKSP
jgi:isoleucyl-tRNA synthetase